MQRKAADSLALENTWVANHIEIRTSIGLALRCRPWASRSGRRKEVLMGLRTGGGRDPASTVHGELIMPHIHAS